MSEPGPTRPGACSCPGDIGVLLADRPGSLADLGETLAAVGVSLQGGGVFTHDGVGVAHFLVQDVERAREALERAGLGPVVVSPVVLLSLDQGVPGQLGRLARVLAGAGVDVLVQYSDHDHRLVLVVPEQQLARGRELASRWDAGG